MKVGVHVLNYTWPGGPQKLAQDLTRVAQAAEDNGFDQLNVMDHLWQVAHNGPPENEMLKAYATLGYLAARTTRIRLLALVTAAIYREPGLLAKAVTTLDVLSAGRAGLGIGAGSSEEEARGLGLPFPPARQRSERLEEALQICLQMWSDNDGPYAGRHYRLARTLNSPQPLTRPHPPILIGGAGEKKTLRLVARYAQACNLPAGPDLRRKLDILRGHCDAVGRDYDEIEKTVSGPLDPGPGGQNVNALIGRMRELAKLASPTTRDPCPTSRPSLRSRCSAGGSSPWRPSSRPPNDQPAPESQAGVSPSHYGARRPKTPTSTRSSICGLRPPGAAAANHTLPRRDSPPTEREEPRCSPSSSPP